MIPRISTILGDSVGAVTPVFCAAHSGFPVCAPQKADAAIKTKIAATTVQTS
jgi:hypothetical protein